MSVPATITPPDDHTMILLARELACSFFEVEDVIARYGLNAEQFEELKQNPKFVALLEQMTQEWEHATNTGERTKLKAAALIEQWLPEANVLIHDRSNLLSGRVELGKLLAKIGGVGGEGVAVNGNASEKFIVNINLGQLGGKLKFQKEITHKVIEGEVVSE